MISFRQFISEGFTEVIPKEEYRPIGGSAFKGHVISRDVLGHRVSMTADTIDDKKYHIDYTVDGQCYRQDNDIPMEHRAAILNTVGNMIHSYVHHFKPQAVRMFPVDPRAAPMYKVFGQSLAKRHGGRIAQQKEKTMSTLVKFDHPILSKIKSWFK